MTGNMDMPVYAGAGLVLNASPNPTGLMNQWIKAAKAGVTMHQQMLEKDALGNLSVELDELGLDSLEVDEASVGQEPLNTLVGSAQRIEQTLYAPVRFRTSESTWWAMVDSGAQVSIISTGLLDHLSLLDTKGFRVFPSAFTVSGFTGGDRLNMPIVEVEMRLGVRGGEERWQKVQLAVLETMQYKFILGMDMLQPL